MQNVYMTPLRYKNFAGVEKNVKLHFHLTPREMSDWMIDNYAEAQKLLETFTEMQPGMENDPLAEATQEQKLAMLQMVRVLAELSYGKPSDDGEVFDKSETKKFVYSAAYDAFRLFLFTNPKELGSFIQTILNPDVMGEFSSQIEAMAKEQVETEASAPAQLKSVQNGPKDPKDMSREELLAAMEARNKQQ